MASDQLRAAWTRLTFLCLHSSHLGMVVSLASGFLSCEGSKDGDGWAGPGLSSAEDRLASAMGGDDGVMIRISVSSQCGERDGDGDGDERKGSDSPTTGELKRAYERVQEG